MAVSTQSGVPARITAGDTVVFTDTVSGHAASAWNLDFVIYRDGINLATIRATASGDDFLVTITETISSALTPGRASFTRLLTEISSDQREAGLGGAIFIAPDPTASMAPTAAQTQLAAANAAITELKGNASVSFNGQSFTKYNLKDLLDARDRLQIIVNDELRALGLSQKGGAKTILTRFRG